MKNAFIEDQIRTLKNIDLMGMSSAISTIQYYFERRKDNEDWYIGTFHREKDKKEIINFQKILSEKLNEIKRPLNKEEKKEIERLKILCDKEV